MFHLNLSRSSSRPLSLLLKQKLALLLSGTDRDKLYLNTQTGSANIQHVVFYKNKRETIRELTRVTFDKHLSVCSLILLLVSSH